MMSHVGDSWVKLLLYGPNGETETPWAEPLGDNRFRLDNLPWFAYGVSDDDIVEGRPTASDGVFEFVRVVTPSGNRLIRLVFENASDSSPVLDRLTTLGCHYEGANPKYIAVSIPLDVSYEVVANALTESGVRWECANPTYEEVFPGQA